MNLFVNLSEFIDIYRIFPKFEIRAAHSDSWKTHALCAPSSPQDSVHEIPLSPASPLSWRGARRIAHVRGRGSPQMRANA